MSWSRGSPGYTIRLADDAYWDREYLMHYGISGQRWGIRRFQNEDRSLTEEGKRRYGIGLGKRKPGKDEDVGRGFVRTQAEREKTARELERRKEAAEKRQEEAADELIKALDERYTDAASENRYAKAYLNMQSAKKGIKDIEILQKINRQKHISQHRLNLEKKYMDKGMTEEQAKIAAYKRDRTEKMVAIAAVTTIAVAGAWLYKNHMADIDKIIPKDTRLQNLSADSNKGVKDAFYAAYDEGDKRKYLGLFGGGHLQQYGKVDVQQMTAKAMSEMRIAGANVGRDTANELLANNQGYRESLKGMLESHGVGSNKKLGMLMEMNGMGGYRNVQEALYDGKTLNKKGYQLLNRMLVDHSYNGQNAADTLFEALRKKGYDGTIDLNDVFDSGYDAKAPVVVFNGGNKLGEVTRATIDPDTLQGRNAIESAKVYAKQLAKTVVPRIAAGTAFAKGVTKLGEMQRRRHAERRLIEDYKKEHPNTKLSDKDILKNIIK